MQNIYLASAESRSSLADKYRDLLQLYIGLMPK